MPEIIVKDTTIRTVKINSTDYICITDIASQKNSIEPKDVVKNWLRLKNTIEYLGLWESMHNPDFKRIDFDTFKEDAMKHFNEFANGFIVFLFNIQILKYCGDTSLSIYSAISNCVILFNSLFTGVGQSVQPIIATNYGAGYTDRIQKLKKLSLFTIVILGMIFSLSGIMFPESVCKIFLTITPEMSDIAKRGIRLYFVAFLPMGINLLTSYLLQAVMKVKKALLISLLRNILLSSVCILLFPILFGGDSLWMVMPVVEIQIMVISIFFLGDLLSTES